MKKKITFLALCAMPLALCFPASAQQPKVPRLVIWLKTMECRIAPSADQIVDLGLREPD